MPLQISPFANAQFCTTNGLLAAGYKLYTYLAGTSQKEPVFVDIAGLASHTNPIILNSSGRPPAAIFLQIAKSYKFVYALPTDTDPPVAPVYTADYVSVGFDVAGAPALEWVLGTVPSYVDATSFTLIGDQTVLYHLGRRLRLISPLGTKYGTIASSVFGAVTTVTVVLDFGTLDLSLSSVYYSFLSAQGSSFPSGFTTGLDLTLNGSLTIPPTSNFNLLPVGGFFPYAGSALPVGYLWCDGTNKSRLTYPGLFGAIGIRYGAGDGSTTFGLPDMRGQFALGLDNMGGTPAGRVTSASFNGAQALTLGGVGGEETHLLTIAEIPSHNHAGKTLSTGVLQNSDEAGATNQTSVKRADFSVQGTGGGGVHNNMPPWMAVPFIIRYA